MWGRHSCLPVPINTWISSIVRLSKARMAADSYWLLADIHHV
jgi:hypothetical protein